MLDRGVISEAQYKNIVAKADRVLGQSAGG
jgi:hypothetical protein